MSKNKKITIKIAGMNCKGCESTISEQVNKLNGIKHIKVDYAKESAVIIYNPEKVNVEQIIEKISEKGYECECNDACDKNEKSSGEVEISSWLAYVFIAAGIIVLSYFIFRTIDGIQLPELSQNMGYGLLFLVGLITGFHCIAMCGGFVISYTAKGAAEKVPAYKLHSLYAIGKLISYTLIGAVFGFVGSIIAFTPTMRGVAGILAGIFLVIYGIKMLNIFPFLRRFSLSTPLFISRLVSKGSAKSAKSGIMWTPFIIGLLNGLMIACGPLQAIYIMAAGTGSALEGAKLLFIFALGTLPVMLGFGYIASMFSSKFTRNLMKISGIIIIVLGLIMFNRGLALTGSGYDLKSLTAGSSSQNINPANNGNTKSSNTNPNIQVAELSDGYQIIRMDVLRSGWSPSTFVIKKGVPVKWIINGKELTGCNSAIQVPKYNLQFKIKSGEQTVEFTPAEEGTVSWSCWMGMIQGTFIVKNDLNADVNQITAQAATPVKSGASCGGGGGCGCMG